MHLSMNRARSLLVPAPSGRLLLSLLALGVMSLALPEQAEALDPEPGASTLYFLGWSKDSKWIAYRRIAATPKRTARGVESVQREQRMHRRVRDGRFDGFGKMVGGDVAEFAKGHGYVVDAIPARVEGPRLFHFELGASEIRLEIEVGSRLGFRVTQDGVPIFGHAFDRLYVAFEPELYPSPDRGQAMLVFHLESGWDVDAAIFPLRLRPLRPKPLSPPVEDPARAVDLEGEGEGAPADDT